MQESTDVLHTQPKQNKTTAFSVVYPASRFSVKKHYTCGSKPGLRISMISLTFFLCVLLLGGCSQSINQSPASTSTKSAQNDTSTYVAIGASDTFGIGTSDPYHQNWPTDLVNLMGDKIHLVNLGVPGMTLHTALSAELPIALDAHPTLVTVWLAVNDLATNVPLASYSHDLDLLLSRLQTALPHARIAVGNVPDLTSVPFFYNDDPVTLSQQIDAYNTIISNVVLAHHVILVDLSGARYNLQAFPQYISSDGLHPSATGYEQLAVLFYRALQKG